MHHRLSLDIHLSTTYYLLVYDFTYKTLGRTRPGIFTAAEKCKYRPPKKVMELEINLLLNLSRIHPEIILKISYELLCIGMWCS